jgi:BolA family transcriptional regulator, general stress-responsive regulator
MAEAPLDRVARIQARLRAALEPQVLRLHDDSARHAGHEGAKGGGGHYRLHLVSARFEGLPRLARHRLVYDSLGDLLEREVHALAMTLQSPTEFDGSVD